jgi:hypothetical protein
MIVMTSGGMVINKYELANELVLKFSVYGKNNPLTDLNICLFVCEGQEQSEKREEKLSIGRGSLSPE